MGGIKYFVTYYVEITQISQITQNYVHCLYLSEA